MKNIYLVFGTEQFLIERKIKTIISSVLKENTEFNTVTYDLLETPIQYVIEDCETIPFLSDYKVVIATNPVFLTAQTTKNEIEHDLELLTEYLNHPSETTILIFEANYEKLDERKKITKKIKEVAEVSEANILNEVELKNSILKIFKNHNQPIKEDALDLMVERVGNNFGLIYQEVQKLMLYKSNQEMITKEDIELLVSRSLEQNVFDLIDAVVSKNRKKSMTIYYDLLNQNEEVVKLIILLASQFRLIYQTMILYRKGYTERDIAQRLGIHPYRVKLAAQKMRSFTEKQLLHYIDQLGQLDYQIKSGKIDKKIGMELFLLSQ